MLLSLNELVIATKPKCNMTSSDKNHLNLKPSSSILSLISVLIIILSNIDVIHTRLIHDLAMPNIRPLVDDSYFCTAKKLNRDQTEYIVSYVPNASAAKVHHILIYGCSTPGHLQRDTPHYVWECGEMGRTNRDESGQPLYETGQVCGKGKHSTILYAWALDAPALELPEGVGFKIGGDTGIDYLVLQVHYGHTHDFQANPELTDDAGIVFRTVTEGIDKLAGIYLMMSYGYVQKGLSRHKLHCLINEPSTKVIHPFRFRTHTHKLGTKVAAFLLPRGETNIMHLIGQHDPQKPQMFYPATNSSLVVRGGDRIEGYCEYNNIRNRIVNIGATGNDEMCNFYMMYWTEGHDLLKQPDCLTQNPTW